MSSETDDHGVTPYNNLSETTKESKEPVKMTTITTRSPMFHACHLSLSMMLVFLAFSVAQNSQTSLSPQVGSIGLGILYGTFTLGNTISSWLVQGLGLRMSLFLGGLCYAGYVAANIYTVNVILYMVSGVIGLGAAILWTAQGSFIAECASAHEIANHLEPHSMLGQFNGIFFSIFQVNQLVGNLLAALLYQFHVEKSIVFSVFAAICMMGVASLLLLPRKIGPNKVESIERASLIDHEDQEVVPVEATGLIAGLKRALVSLTLLKDPRMLLLVVIIIYSGIEQSWMYGTFPPLIKEQNYKFYVLAALGGLDAFFSYVMGKLSDKIGRIAILLIGTLAHGMLYMYFLIFVPHTLEYGTDYDIPTGYFFLMALALAIGDGAFNTQIYSILGTYFKDRPTQAFANFKLFQAASTAGFFGFTGQDTKPTVFNCTLIATIALGVGITSLLIGRVLYPYSQPHDVEDEVSQVPDVHVQQEKKKKRHQVTSDSYESPPSYEETV